MLIIHVELIFLEVKLYLRVTKKLNLTTVKVLAEIEFKILVEP